MATLQELRGERLRKLQDLKKLGINPYPAMTAPITQLSDVVKSFDSYEGKEITVAGRLMGTRKFGKIAFFVLRDGTGQIQLFLKHDIMNDREQVGQSEQDGITVTAHHQVVETDKNELAYAHLNLLDPGDFIEATGKVIKTQTGEISIEVRKLRLLTKSLRPMPTAQEGF